jgi:hypothetical protein
MSAASYTPQRTQNPYQYNREEGEEEEEEDENEEEPEEEQECLTDCVHNRDIFFKSKQTERMSKHEVELCDHCVNGTTHPLFLYLLIDDRVDFVTQPVSRDQMYVGLSSQPLEHVKCHNRQVGYKAAAKGTKHNAGHWKLQLCMRVHSAGKRHKLSSRKTKSADKLIAFLKYIFELVQTNQDELFCPRISDMQTFLGVLNNTKLGPKD